jgi:hypothetical protein
LSNPKDVEQQLRRNSLDAIVADFTVQPFQRRAPGIGISGGRFGCCLVQFFHK